MIRDLAQLARFRVCVLVALACGAGYVLARPAIEPALFLVMAASALLAAASSCLNQIQEKDRDALMRRTQCRPLPSRRMSAVRAGLICAAGFAAACVLLAARGPASLLLGGLAVAVYNAAYTPLKIRTPYCVLIGGLAGAVPPLLGYAAAGGSPLEARILAVALVLYLWQVPHFWLLALRHREDYARAGFAVLPGAGAGARSRLPLLSWLACLGAAMCLVPAYLPGAPGAAVLLPALACVAASAVSFARLRLRFGLALVNIAICLFLAGVWLEAPLAGAGQSAMQTSRSPGS